VPDAGREGEERMVIIKNVLVSTDFSPIADAALDYGRALARTFASRLHVLHVVDDFASKLAYADAAMPGFAPAALQADIERAAGKDLEALVTTDDRRELQAIAVLKVGRSIAQEITDYARDASIDIIVIGATGRGAIDRMLMGSVADKVIRRAPCPVLTIRQPEREFVKPDALQVSAHAGESRV
jgi:nucleotide-binding universal stress UspA family protein